MTQTADSAVYTGQCLRTGAWYGDAPLDLEFPPHWDLLGHWPETPPPLTENELALALEKPVGQRPLRTLCQKAKRPLIVVDDVNRPTPVACVLPLVLRHFRDAGIDSRKVTVLLATGTHASPQDDSVLSKVGPEAGSRCRIVVHTLAEPVRRIGKTRFGTPVYVNREVLDSDFVLGIGGIYPNHTAGYGGGSKLALGVLGFRSILALHYFHRSVGRSRCAERNAFREDLDEIAQMLGFRTLISIQCNAFRQPIRIACGDHRRYFKNEVDFARRVFTVPMPGNADVVISNAYPCDVSLTFAYMKGAAPLHQCPPAASRILIASCPEGSGGHGLFPNIDVPRFQNLRNYLRFGLIRPVAFAQRAKAAAWRRMRGAFSPKRSSSGRPWRHPIWVYVPNNRLSSLPCSLPGVNIVHSWADVLEGVKQEQGEARDLRVVLYPCVPLLSFSASAQ